MGRGCSLKQLVNNASRVLVIDKTRPQFLRYSSDCKLSYCEPIVNHEIPSSSLFEGFIKTTRRVTRFYRRTFFEHVPSSRLVTPGSSKETDEALHFFIWMHEVGVGEEDIKVSVEKNKTVAIIGEGDGVFEATRGYKKYVCYIDLPDIDSPVKMYTTRGVKANKMFACPIIEIIIPKLKEHEKQDGENVNEMTFDVKVNRTYEDEDNKEDNDDDNNDDHDDEDEEYDCDGRHNFSLTRVYAYLRNLLF